jgi:hypothetical protein
MQNKTKVRYEASITDLEAEIRRIIRHIFANVLEVPASQVNDTQWLLHTKQDDIDSLDIEFSKLNSIFDKINKRFFIRLEWWEGGLRNISDVASHVVARLRS